MSLTSPVALLNRAAEAAPDAIGYVCGEDAITYRDALAIAKGLADDLAAINVRGRAVVLALPNGIPVCLYAFAAQAAGAMLCTVNPAYTARELSEILSDAEPAAIVCAEEGAATIGRAAPADVHSIVVPDGARGWLASCRRSDGFLPVPPADTISTLQYTGGTSGRPKGVMLTHAAVARNIEQREAILPTVMVDERVLCVMPLFHVFAQSMCLHLTAMALGTLHILPRYRPDWTLDALESARITRFPAGPTVFNGLVGYEGFEGRDWSALRCAYSGSAPLSVATLERWEAATGAPIYEGYGQTEAGPILTFNGPGFEARPGTVGRPVEGTEIRLLDLADDEKEARPGEAGEIVARGPQVMAGYKGMETETRTTLRDGWLHTGDVGRFDEAGYLVIEDRKKDLVLVGGFNVYPREVDEVLMSHACVSEAAVIGVPDRYRGERLVAYVVVKDGTGAAALQEHCEAHLTRYKQPSEYVFVDVLPRTPAQKIDKRALREGRRSDVA